MLVPKAQMFLNLNMFGITPSFIHEHSNPPTFPLTATPNVPVCLHRPEAGETGCEVHVEPCLWKALTVLPLSLYQCPQLVHLN